MADILQTFYKAFNSLRAKFFREKIHFMSLLHIDMTKVSKSFLK